MLVLLLLVPCWLSPRRLSLVGKDDASHVVVSSPPSMPMQVVDGDLLFASAVMSAETVPKTKDDSNDSEKRGGTIDEMVDRISNRIMVVRKDSNADRGGAFMVIVMIICTHAIAFGSKRFSYLLDQRSSYLSLGFSSKMFSYL